MIENSSQPRRLAGIRKIAVLRANAIGDFIFTLPALEALRAAYPDVQITLLAKPWHEQALANRPLPFDRVIAVPPSRGVNTRPGCGEDADEDPEQLTRFFRRMQREHFDLGIQLHGGGRYSNPFLLQIEPRITVGMKTTDAAPLDLWIPYIYFQSEVSRLLEVVSLVGASPVTLAPRFPVIQADLDEVYQVFPELPLRLVLIHPGASDPRRRWAPEKFAAVGDALSSDGATIAIIGSADDVSLAESISDAMVVRPLNLAGKFSLGVLAGVLSRCSLLIANDSGPRHLGEAVGAQTVGIYWCANMINAAPMTRARHRTAISWRLTCPVCGTNIIQSDCTHQASLVDDVSIDEVLNYARDLLSFDEKASIQA